MFRVDRSIYVDDRLYAAEVETSANWVVHSFGRHGGFTRGGYYDYVLASSGPELRIKSKKITLLDDRLETAVDFYHL